MVSLAATLLLLIAVFKLWPAPVDDEAPLRYGARASERILIEEVIPSSQTLEQKPPPPAPLVPVVVPDEVVLEEVEIDVKDNFLPVSDPSDDAALAEGDPDVRPASRGGIARAAKPVRFVEPEYTRAARRRRIRAEVVVEVVVDERGRVQEARVLERFLIGEDEADPKRPVEEIGYGLEEAALAAARRWQFRPARLDGKPVPDQATLTFFFGV